MAKLVSHPSIEVTGPATSHAAGILTSEALAFVADLHRRFEAVRRERLADRARLQARWDARESPGYLAETGGIREGPWRVRPAPADLQDRRVEITGPVDRKMMINALNSGARVFMADFEDALSPTWANVVEGQANVRDAVRGNLSYTSPDGRVYRVEDEPAVLVVRPRGWHLVERHVLVDGEAVSASLFDAGIFLWHNARELLARGSGPYLYLAKTEHHLEARLWDDVLRHAESALGLPAGAVRVTVLIETLPAAYQMEEILHALRDRVCGLNAGRWDYLFSIIKKLRNHPGAVLPDRSELTMTAPFMRAYTELLVATCHRRGAHAIGGMAAFIPNRRDPEVTERALRKVREDKEREARDGFDGTWVAHPDLVGVATEVFDRALGNRQNQLTNTRPDLDVAGIALDRFRVPGAAATEAGLRHNLRVALLYTESWLRGIGAAAIDNLMEDAATAEISRSQVWQWIRHQVRLADTGAVATRELCERILAEEKARAERDAPGPGHRFDEAADLLRGVALESDFTEFLTLPAYERLETRP